MADSHVESLYPYPTNIYIQDKAQAAAFAHSILTEGHQQRILIIWADGSACGGHGRHPCAGAITFVSPRDGLRKEIVTISHHHHSGDAEILAVWEAFRQVAQLAELFDRLMVFSDSQGALQSVQAPRKSLQKSRCEALINDILKHANAFYNEGIEVEMHWLPSDAHVYEHAHVDELARMYGELVPSVSPLDISKIEVIFTLVTLLLNLYEDPKQELKSCLCASVKEAIAEGRFSGVKIVVKRENKKMMREEKKRAKRLAKLAARR